MATPKSGGQTALRPGRRRPRATPTSPWQPPARTKSPLLALDAHRQNNRCETVLPQSLLPPIVVGSSESERQAFLESGNFPAWTLDTEPYQCRSPNQIRECRSPQGERVTPRSRLGSTHSTDTFDGAYVPGITGNKT